MKWDLFFIIMEAKVQKQIIDYFSYFEEFYNTTKTRLKDCQNCAVAINKLIKRCCNIKDAEVIGSPLEEFKGLQTKLCTIIHNLISEEVQDIKNILSTLEELFEKLCHKNNILRDSCRGSKLEQNSFIVKGNPYQPPLRQILEFAEDSITFGSQIIAQIQTALEVLTFKGLQTDSLVDNFQISAKWRRRVPEIIAYTSFIAENHI